MTTYRGFGISIKYGDQGFSLEPLGDFDTLSERLHAEVKAFKTATPLPDSVWARKPAD